MHKHIIKVDENNRVVALRQGMYTAVTSPNEYLITHIPNLSVIGSVFDPTTKTFTFDEEYDAQTAINTPPAEPEVTEPPAE